VVFFTLVIGAQSSRSQDFAAVDSFNYYYDSKDYGQAIEHWNEIHNDQNDFEIFKKVGNCYYHLNDCIRARTYYNKAITRLKKEDLTDLIILYTNIADSYVHEANYSKAYCYIEKVELLAQQNNLSIHHNFYLTKANYFALINKVDSSETYYLKALKAYKTMFGYNSQQLLPVYSSILYHYLYKDVFTKALDYGIKGIQIAQIFDNEYFLFVFNYNVGNIYYRSRDWVNALKYYEIALAYIYEELEGYRSYIQNATFYCYSKLNKFPQNISFEEYWIAMPQDTFMQVIHLSNFGNYFENRTRDYPKALEKYRQGFSLNQAKHSKYHLELVNDYWIIGRTYHKYQKYDSSLYYFQRALYCNSKDVDTLDYATNPQDVFNADKRLPEIIARKLESLMAIKLQELEKDSLKSINQLMVANCSYYSHCVEAGLRDKTFMQDRLTALKKEIRRYMLAGMDAAHDLYQDHHDIYYLEKALHFSETGKYLLVKSMMMQRNQATQLPDSLARLNTLLSNNINRLHMKKVQLEANNDTLLIPELQQQLFNLILQQDSLRNIIFHKYPASINREFNELSLHEISGSVEDGQLLLNYFLEDTVLHVHKISPDTIIWQRFQQAQNIRSRVNDLIDFCNPVSDPIIEKHTYQDIATRLTEILVGDTSMFTGIEELVIIPDQELVLLPFEILLTYNPGVKTFYKSLPYLLHEFPISYYHSLSGLPSNSNQEKNPAKGFVAIAPGFVGKIEQIRQGYTKIEQARAEAEYLTDLFDGELLTGSQAQKSNLSPYLQNASVIHFATHTKTDTSGLMNTGLVLPSDTSQNVFDPLLTSEICCMDIPADLVMLSACESGSGQLLDGEGVISLGWAFEYAGSKSVGYSLFSLDDASANQIMTSFYEGLKEGLPKNVALQQAKQDFLKTVTSIKTHPKYWAGLAVIGDQSPLPGLSSHSNKLRSVTFLAGLLMLVMLVIRNRKLRK
jgi:CHAT domain-containing protein